MNKIVMVLGVTAVATLVGCKDPAYSRNAGSTSQNEAKPVEPAPTETAKPDEEKPVVTETKPVEEKPATAETKPAPAPEPEYTIYVVQNGDYLAKISKRFNVTIAAIKRLNPSIKNDVVKVGQKLKLPGKIDVSAAPAAKAQTTTKKAVTPYTGATKEYVVKSGDTLGGIAYAHGIGISQLKELNGLSKDVIRVGQKLKVPAEKVAKAAKPKTAEKKTAPAKTTAAAPADNAAPAKQEAPAAAPAEEKPVVESAAAPAAEPVAAQEDAPAAEAATVNYIVQDGEDVIGLSIRFGVSASQIRELNGLSKEDKLAPGQVIKLPAEAQQ